MPTHTIESTRFGTLEIASEDVIEFPDGLIGLGGRRYAIVTPKAEGAFSWLHSIDDPTLALPVAMNSRWLPMSPFESRKKCVSGLVVPRR